MRFRSLVAVLTLIAISSQLVADEAATESTEAPATEATQAPAVLKHKMKKLDGKEVDLKQYKGKVVLIVNVASKCGLTPQYTALQQLHKEHQKSGLAVLGFPCNQFGGQEPGAPEEIQSFCKENYGVSFDLFSKIEVNGEGACDLYKQLTATKAPPVGDGKIKWNFEKFLVGRDGKLVARFSPRTKPNSEEVINKIKEELAKKPAS